MTQQEFLKHCHYYKGEQTNPYDRDKDYNKFLFWVEERACCKRIGDNADFLTHYIARAKDYEQRNKNMFDKQRSQNLSATTKGLLLYIEAKVTKWIPWIDRSFIYDY